MTTLPHSGECGYGAACSRQAESASTRVGRRRTFGTSGLKYLGIFATLAAVGTFRGNARSERPVGTLRLPASHQPRLTDMPLPTDELLSAFHDGEVTSGERAAVEQRLVTSADARRELSEIREISALLKELPRDRLPSEFPQQVLQAIEREMLIPSQAADSTESSAARVTPARRWIGAAAVLTSAAGLLLLLRTLDDPAGRDGKEPQHLAGSPNWNSAPAGVATDSPSAMNGSVSVVQDGDVAAGAAGLNAVIANSQTNTFGGARLAGSENLFFDQAALGTAEVGDVVRAIQRTEGDEVAVVLLTVVDRQQGLEGLQLLLSNNQFARSEEVANTKADRGSSPTNGTDEMQAVLVMSDAAQLETALKQLRQEKYLQSLEVDQPILIAQLDEARGGRAALADEAKRANAKSLPEPASSTRRMKPALPEVADKKPLATAAAPGSAAKATESRVEKEQLANQTRFGVSAQVLQQNQLSQNRARGLSKGAPRSQTVAEKDANAPSGHRPLQVLFVVVDQSQAGKQQTSPGNSSKPAAAPAKTRGEPVKPNGQDGAA